MYTIQGFRGADLMGWGNEADIFIAFSEGDERNV